MVRDEAQWPRLADTTEVDPDDDALQRRVFRDFRRGPDPEAVALHAVLEVSPGRVLDVGAGDGAFAERLANALPAVDLVAVDISPRAVELARARGIDARLGDVQDLSFPDRCFDCVVANWMLYLAPDLDMALAEVARVLRAGGRLVAGAVASTTFAEIRELLGGVEPRTYSFSAENGTECLRPYFSRIERRDVKATIVFPSWSDVRDFVALAPERMELVDRIPRFRGSFSTRNHLAIFVADK